MDEDGNVPNEENQQRTDRQKGLSRYSSNARLLLLLLMEIIGLLLLSQEIVNGQQTENPSGIMGASVLHLGMTFLSIVLFSTILYAFTKYVFVAQRKSFGLTNLLSYRAFLFFLVQLIFISLLFVVVDISLVGVFTLHGITLPSWYIVVNSPPDQFATLPRGDDRLTYATYRAYFFFFFLSLLLVFPIFSMIALVTRFGRERLKTVDTKSLLLSKSRILGSFYKISVLLILVLGIGLTAYIMIIDPVNFLSMLILGAVMIGTSIFVLTVLFVLTDLLRRIFHVGMTLGGYNLLILVPILFLFYLLPVLLWTFWDLYVILVHDTTERTIFDHSGTIGVVPPIINPSDYSINNPNSMVTLTLLSLRLNLLNPVRIYELDFIFIIGISAIVIGVVEGFSIISILSRLLRGSILSGGIGVSASTQRIGLLTRIGQLLLMVSWVAIAWDRLSNIVEFLQVEFNFQIDINIVPVLESLILLMKTFTINSQIIEISFLFVIPLYIVVASSLKFFSVSLVLERVKEDLALFMLIVSSAFVLIITKIYGDVIALPQFDGSSKQFLPFEIIGGETVIPFVVKIFRNIEGVAFYIGFAISIVYGMNQIRKWIATRGKDQ